MHQRPLLSLMVWIYPTSELQMYGTLPPLVSVIPSSPVKDRPAVYDPSAFSPLHSGHEVRVSSPKRTMYFLWWNIGQEVETIQGQCSMDCCSEIQPEQRDACCLTASFLGLWPMKSSSWSGTAEVSRRLFEGPANLTLTVEIPTAVLNEVLLLRRRNILVIMSFEFISNLEQFGFDSVSIDVVRFAPSVANDRILHRTIIFVIRTGCCYRSQWCYVLWRYCACHCGPLCFSFHIICSIRSSTLSFGRAQPVVPSFGLSTFSWWLGVDAAHNDTGADGKLNPIEGSLMNACDECLRWMETF